MALNNFKCYHLMPLQFKGSMNVGQTIFLKLRHCVSLANLLLLPQYVDVS